MKKPDKNDCFTQSSYPAYIMPSDEDYKTLLKIGGAKLQIFARSGKMQ